MKKIMIGFCLIILGLLVGCKKTQETPPEPGPDDNPKPVVEKIQVTDRAGKVIETDSVYQSDERTYSHSHLYVWTVYSDETKKNVTKSAKFSEVSIKEAKDIEVTVSYESFETSYTLKVLANEVTNISIDYTNCNLLYPVGAIFDPDGLVVLGTLSDGTVKTLTDYSVSLKNDNQDLTHPLTDTGKKKVVVTYGNLSQEFDILIYEPNSLSNYVYKIDYLVDELVLDEKGSYEFTSSYEAMNNSIATIRVNSTSLKTKEENGNSIEHTYTTETYHSYISIPKTEGIEITLPYKTDVFLVVADLHGQTVSFVKDGVTHETFGNKSKYTSVLYCSLDAGTYQLVSSDADNRLYSITFQSSRAIASDIELDTTDAKKIYAIGEALDLSGLKVYYIWDDGTKSMASKNNISYRIMDSANTTVSSWKEEGKYTVVITLGAFSKSFSVEVTNTTLFTGIELDTTNVTKEFNGTDFNYDNLKVYGIAAIGRELLTEGTDYIVTLSYDNKVVSGFSEIGIYTVTITYLRAGCENNKSFYTVKFMKEVSRMSLDTSLVKREYIVGENLDISNLGVQLLYKDNTTGALSLSQIKREILRNGISVNSLSEVGEYQVSIHYGDFEENFTINVSAARHYLGLELDTTKVTKIFNGTQFNSNQLKVYGLDTGGNRTEFSMGDLKIELIFNGVEVSGFSTSGTYTVNVIYIGSLEIASDTITYDVVYTAKKIQFAYSGPNVPTEPWEDDISYPLDYTSYIQVPDSTYVFLGFNGDLEGTNLVKIYVDKKKTGSACTYTYVTPRYEYIYSDTSMSTPEVPAYLLKDNEVFDHYELVESLSDANYKLYVAICIEQTIEPIISISSVHTASITLPTSLNATIQGVLKDSDGNEQTFSNLSEEFSSLDPNLQYTISGFIVTSSGTIKIMETSFTTNVAATLTSITEDQAVRHVSAGSLEIDCTPYLQAIPNGYQLVGFQLANEAGEIVAEISYTPGMETAYFTNLVDNTKYYVYSCYKEVGPATFNLREESKFTYNFRFIGFWIISYGDELYRIRMQYQGATLYTWYVGNYNYLDNIQLCQFVLPNELRDYVVLGCEIPLYNITEDIDVEVILVKKSASQELVAFYGFQNVLLGYEYVTSGSTPSYPPTPETAEWGKYTYKFTGWIESMMFVGDTFIQAYKAVYTCTNETAFNLVYPYEFYIFTDKLYRERAIYTGSKYYVDYYERIYSSTGTDITDTLAFVHTSGTQGANCGDYTGLKPDTEYVFKGYLIYNLLDGNGNQTKEYSYTFKTMALDATKNVTITAKRSTTAAFGLQVSANKNNFNTYVFYYDHYIDVLYNDEYIAWDYFDLGKLSTVEELKIYYADREELEDNTMFVYVYPSKSLTYQLDKIREVEVESISVEYVSGQYGLEYANITVKGKNVAYANLHLMCPADYFELNGQMPIGIEVASYLKTISDDEVVYQWHVYWPLGSDEPYQCMRMSVSDFSYEAAGTFYCGICEFTEMKDGKPIAYFSVTYW
ncbi:MAG: bacterial Ig-like domain-containing protein [Anaeroplasmataceae bacterium]|nr:bacterial Ig-like domain-containing protein [Anaeroplasmataceae bacterium]